MNARVSRSLFDPIIGIRFNPTPVSFSATSTLFGSEKGVKEPVLSRAFEYWRNIDKTVGDRIAQGVKGERIAAE